MRITKKPVWKYVQVPLATAVLATMVSTPTQAIPFTLGDGVEGSFDGCHGRPVVPGHVGREGK